ncbi:MAG: hypothetical protein IPJ34_24610 [Myxococcales bacterium]|nr:hypothetical protein [Myxococcales bacterium]
MRSSLLALACLLPVVGCVVTTHDDGPCADGACYSGKPTGPVHGLRSDGRVDVTAAEAWPARVAEPPGLSAIERARACVALGACLGAASDPAVLTGLCVLPDAAEERAIPSSKLAERRSWVLRTALAGKSCTELLALETPLTSNVYCEESGCWWTSNAEPIPKVTCAGEVATMVTAGKSYVRDCSHAYQKCDPTSPTGCTDRHPVACDPAGKDRCDGSVRLGCDHNGRVSFRDCARIAGGTCKEGADGTASCVYPDADTCSTSASKCSADGKSVAVCVDGATTHVDCTSLGYTRCDAGRCVK